MNKRHLIVLTLGLLAIIAYTVIFLHKKPTEPQEKDLVELIKENPSLNRTDTINVSGPIFLINAKMGDLLNVFLQKWNVIPPTVVHNNDQIWALFASNGVGALKILGSIYNFAVIVTNDNITFENGTDIKGKPITSTNFSFKSNGQAGEALWNVMDLEKQPFIFVLPADSKLPEVNEGDKVDKFLSDNNLQITNVNDVWTITKKN